MGAVYGVSLKYVALASLSGYAVYNVATGEAWTAGQVPQAWTAGQVPQALLLMFLVHVCLVNTFIALLFNLGMGMSLLGKDPATGSVPRWSYFMFGGFHLPTWLYTRLHQIKDRKMRVPVATEVEPGWWVGGRYAGELGRCWAGTIDLTCEFPEGCAEQTEQYLLLRCWDGAPPPPAEIERAALFGVSARAGGDVMVHCAHGRGRSTTVMCACLVKAGLHNDWEAAFEAIKGRRQVVKLNRGMRAALAKWQAEYTCTTPKRAAAEASGAGSEASSYGERLLRRALAVIKRVLAGWRQSKEM